MNWVGGARHRVHEQGKGERKLIKEHFERQRLKTRHSVSVSRHEVMVSQNRRHALSQDVAALENPVFSLTRRHTARVQTKTLKSDKKPLPSLWEPHKYCPSRRLSKPNQEASVPASCLVLFGEMVPKPLKVKPQTSQPCRDSAPGEFRDVPDGMPEEPKPLAIELLQTQNAPCNSNFNETCIISPPSESREVPIQIPEEPKDGQILVEGKRRTPLNLFFNADGSEPGQTNFGLIANSANICENCQCVRKDTEYSHIFINED